MQIYIHRDDQDYGPYSPEMARDYVSQGVFTMADWAWHEGTTEWKQLAEMLETFQPLTMAPPPAPPAPARQFQTAGTIRKSMISRDLGAPEKKKSGFMIALNLALVLMVIAAAYVRFGGGGGMAQHWLAELREEFAHLSGKHPQPTAPRATSR